MPLTPRLIEEIDILRFHHEFHAPTKEALQWVFPSETSHNGRIASEQWPQKAVRDACTDIQRPWTNHDLRRTFATIAAELGAGGFVVDALTNHMTQGVNKAYVHVGFEKHREWLVRIGEHLDGLRNI